MSTGLKVVLWIVGIIGGLLVLLVIGGIFLGRSMMDDVNEAQAFAANATHEQCVDEMAKRMNGCVGMKCIMDSSVFAGTCMAGAKGDRAAYCATVPKPNDKNTVAAWTQEFCTAREIKKESCDIAASMAIAFCSDEMKDLGKK